MTEKAKRQDRDNAREERERLSADMSQEVAPEEATQDDLTGALPADGETLAATDDTVRSADATSRPRSRRTSRKATATQTPSAESTAASDEESVEEIKAPVTLSAYEADAEELMAQGFSAEEALHLIDISRRLETSAEARAAQAELKRLRFTQWLIEHGVLDEFSA